MNRLSLSVFLNFLVITFVALQLLVSCPDEILHYIDHGDVYSEHHDSEEQKTTLTQSNRKARDWQRRPSSPSRNTFQYFPVLPNSAHSRVPSNQIFFLSSVILRI